MHSFDEGVQLQQFVITMILFLIKPCQTKCTNKNLGMRESSKGNLFQGLPGTACLRTDLHRHRAVVQDCPDVGHGINVVVAVQRMTVVRTQQDGDSLSSSTLQSVVVDAA